MNKNRRVLFCKFSALLRDSAEPSEWTIVKVSEYKAMNQNVSFTKFKKHLSLTKVLSWLEADWHIFLTWKLKFGWLPRLILKSMTDYSKITVFQSRTQKIYSQICPYLEFFWSVFSRIQAEYEEILRISPHSVRMLEN